MTFCFNSLLFLQKLNTISYSSFAIFQSPVILFLALKTLTMLLIAWQLWQRFIEFAHFALFVWSLNLSIFPVKLWVTVISYPSTFPLVISKLVRAVCVRHEPTLWPLYQAFNSAEIPLLLRYPTQTATHLTHGVVDVVMLTKLQDNNLKTKENDNDTCDTHNSPHTHI